MSLTRPRNPAAPALPARLIAIAASAGGLHALSVVLGALPADLDAAVIVLLHRLPSTEDGLEAILRGRTALRVRRARAGERLQAGVIDVAPADQHLRVVAGALIALDSDAPVAYVRPSASILFASAAAVFGAALIAVVLTGRGEDGAAALAAVKRAGGCVVAEDPTSAAAAGMPSAAIATGYVDWVVPLAAIAPTLSRLVQGEAATV